MNTVLVTGASGFIGRHALRALCERGFTVHAVGRQHSRRQDAVCEWHTCDLLSATEVTSVVRAIEPSHLLHLAWETTPGQYWTSAMNYRWVQASLELFRAFQEVGGQRLVAAGSCAEYDWRYGFCSEATTPTDPSSLYGTAKDALRRLLLSWSQQEDVSSAWGRVFFLYGPYEHPDRFVPSAIRSFLRGETFTCMTGDHVRDYLYVQDVADAFVSLVSSDVTGVVNIASGRPRYVAEIAREIARQMHTESLLDVKTASATSGDAPLLVGDARRLLRDVGWTPIHDVSDGLSQTVQWWKEQGTVL